MKHPWYASGDLFLPKPVRDLLETYIIGNDESLFYISLWSFMHMLSGVIFSFVSNSLQGYIVVHTVWEIWQIYIGMTPAHTLRGVIDIFTDTFMGVAGFLLANFKQGFQFQ
jgi:hypothetical protein